MSARIIKKGAPAVTFAPYVPAQAEGGVGTHATTSSAANVSPSGAVRPFTFKAAPQILSQALTLKSTTREGHDERDAAENFVAAPTPDQARADAAEILHAARAEAEHIIAEAHERAAHIEAEAHACGIETGRALAAAEVEELAAPLRAQLTDSLDTLDNLRATLTTRAESDMVRLAVEIAKKIVRREVAVDGDVALTLARVALGRLHGRAAARVRLHPEDCAYAVARTESLARGRSIEIVADASVTRGGCLIETEMGDIDARIEQQFAELEREFLSV